MAIHKIICFLFLFVQIHWPSVSCKSNFSTQDYFRPDDLTTLFGKKYKSDLQSLSLAFKSGDEGHIFATKDPVRGLEDNNDLHSSESYLDLFVNDKTSVDENNEIGGYEDSSFIGSRQNNIEKVKNKVNDFHRSYPARRMLLNARDITEQAKKGQNKWIAIQREKPNIHEAITKMTLNDILSQTEEMKYTSSDKHYVDSKKTSDMNKSRSGNEKRSKNRRIQKRAMFEDDQDILRESGRADAQESGSGVEAGGLLDKQNQTSSKKLQETNDSRQIHKIQIKGEPEFSGRDPLTIFLGTSGSGNGQYSGSGMTAFKPLQPQLPTEDKGSNLGILGRDDSNEGSALMQKVPIKNHLKTAKDKVEGEDKSGIRLTPIDPLLLLEIRKIRMNVLKAEKQATKELEDVRKDFRWKMEDLEEDLRMVKKLTRNVHKKVGLTVTEALATAKQAKTNATARLDMARRASTVLNNIEKKLGVVHTRNASKILRSRIPHFPNLSDMALYKQLLATNKILTRLDGAKELAVYRAEERFRNEEETGSSIAKEVESLRDELASAERELSDETDAEMEDEREAQEKLEEAMKRNKLVAKKTSFALEAVENYLQKLQSDEGKLKQLRFY